MMHHLPDELKKDGLLEIFRVLKPDGTLLIIELDPSDFSLASLIHGHSSQLSAELEKTQAYMVGVGFEPVEFGRPNFRGFSFLKGKKAGRKNHPIGKYSNAI
jgi:hypothetical protein